MATIQRNVKTFGTRSFVGEVAAAPSNLAPILPNEAEADLDTVYAPGTRGADTVNIKDGAVTYAKLATDAKPWTISGATLTPTDTTKTVVVPGVNAGAFQWGTTTAKGRLIHHPSLSLSWWTDNAYLNPAATWLADDATKPSWQAYLSAGNDSFVVGRAPAGTPGSVTNLLVLDSGGNLTLYAAANNQLALGNGTVKAIISCDTAGGTSFYCNNAFAPTDATKQSWHVVLDPAVNGLFSIQRRAQNAGAGVVSTPLLVAGDGQVTAAFALRASSNGGGLRCQNVGTMSGDGYSNAVAFGWDGTLKARIDNTQIGTVTVTSDARLKLDVQEDVPGLDAVLALRPISFEYDQTKRDIGFPKGRHYGLLAQDVQPHAPLVVEEDDSDDHWLELYYPLLAPALIKRGKKIVARVAALEGASA